MRTKLLCLLLAFLCFPLTGQQYAPALPGFRYEFPRDHFNHPEYGTEWWYYTGNLRARDGHRFGFELTFFRQGTSRSAAPSPWSVQDVYMAHLALSDINGGHYYAAERLNRAGPGVAGVNAASASVWNGNWQTTIGEKVHTLHGVGENFSLNLKVTPLKGPVIHGTDGVSRKAEGVGHASYAVDGDTWMDHEFFSDSAGGDEVGWDWFSVQLEDNSELMLYRLRHRDGSVDPYSSGTYVDAQGTARHLSLRDFSVTPTGATYSSPRTGAKYPIAWSLAVGAIGLQIDLTTPLRSQEFISRFGPSYWEGAIDVTGSHDGKPVHGTGYLEMTGYADSKGLLFGGAPR